MMIGEEEKAGHETVETSADTSLSSANESPTAEIYHEDGGLFVDVRDGQAEIGTRIGLKLAQDGHTVLIPQPSDDPNDPMNWSSWKKHAILLTIGVAACIGDFGAAASAPLILAQGSEWHISPNHVNYANNLNVLFIGIFGVAAIPFLYCWGRAPVMFWTMLASTMFTLGCARAPSFEVYYAMKALQGITIGAGQTCGLAFLQDMFFFHEQARKIGIWTVMFIVAPYFGPMFSNFILSGTGNWRDVQWLIFGGGCFSFLCMLCFLDETCYRRDIPIERQPQRGHRILRLVGVWQLRHHQLYFDSIYKSVKRVVVMAVKPVILLILVYYFTNFMWAVGINQTSAILFSLPPVLGGYDFSQKSVGLLYFSPVVGTLLGEAFGHFFNDFVATQYIHKHNGVFVPEARLPPIYIAGCLMVPGLVLVGQALHNHLIWVALAFGWGMYVFGAMVSSVAITAYALDAYPSAPGEVAALINLARLLGGFSVGYFQLEWAIRDGYNVTFGIQGAIVGCGVLVVLILHWFGARLRQKGGLLKLREEDC